MKYKRVWSFWSELVCIGIVLGYLIALIPFSIINWIAWKVEAFIEWMKK